MQSSHRRLPAPSRAEPRLLGPPFHLIFAQATQQGREGGVGGGERLSSQNGLKEGGLRDKSEKKKKRAVISLDHSKVKGKMLTGWNGPEWNVWLLPYMHIITSQVSMFKCTGLGC